MAEGLALAASVIAVVQITEQIIQISAYIISECQFYLGLTPDAPSFLRVILVEISATKAIFETLRFLASCSDGAQNLTAPFTGESGPIVASRKAIAQLEELFPANDVSTTRSKKSKRQRVEATLAALAWPFKRDKAKRLLEEISTYKSSITLALTADSLCINQILYKRQQLMISEGRTSKT
jgi:hypothetical protein